jgi:DNA-binding GntR family transcriptional regulator
MAIDALPVSEKIKAKRIPELVLERLMDWIMDGTISMGERLNAEDLATKLGVSRMPVREALKSMEKYGIVESIPYAGTRVVELSIRDITQIYIIRQALEPLAAYYACQNMTDDKVEIIKKMNENFESVLFQPIPDGKKIFMLNREFHFAIYNYSEMKHLVEAIGVLWYRLGFFKLIYGRNYINDKTSAEKKIAEHRRYIEFLKDRDCDGLRDAVEQALSRRLANVRAQQ